MLIYSRILIAIICFAIVPGIVRGQDPQLRIDGSNEESLKKSFEAIKNNLSANQQKKFEQGLMIIMHQLLHLLDEEYEFFLKEVNGKTGPEIIAEATAIVQRMEQKAKEQKAKKTTYQLFDWIFDKKLGESLGRDKQSSWSCTSVLATMIQKSSMFPSDEEQFKVSENSFLLTPEETDSVMKSRRSNMEAFSKKGTDKLSIEIKDKTMSLITRASVGAGIAVPGEDYEIIQNDKKVLLGIWFHYNKAPPNDAFHRLNVETFLLNKQSGLAIWTKSNSRPNIFIDERPIPEVQSYFLLCS